MNRIFPPDHFSLLLIPSALRTERCWSLEHTVISTVAVGHLLLLWSYRSNNTVQVHPCTLPLSVGLVARSYCTCQIHKAEGERQTGAKTCGLVVYVCTSAYLCSRWLTADICNLLLPWHRLSNCHTGLASTHRSYPLLLPLRSSHFSALRRAGPTLEWWWSGFL